MMFRDILEVLLKIYDIRILNHFINGAHGEAVTYISSQKLRHLIVHHNWEYGL